MSIVVVIKKDLARLKDPIRAKLSQSFFKTGPGQYGEGDIFLGITVPAQRAVAYRHLDATLVELQELLRSKVHEHRFTALEILTAQFERGNEKIQKQIFQFYINNTKYINNWDLVDTSAPYIVSGYLLDRPRLILYKLAKSKNLWERRIAIVGTFGFIAKQQFDDSLRIAKLLMEDSHDLIHKAVGWMLREVGKRDQKVLEKFLKANYKPMPRTMLRYAIERFPEKTRKAYLVGTM